MQLQITKINERIASDEIQVTSEHLRHVLILHTAEWNAIPGQFAPFVEGAGLSHRRVLVLVGTRNISARFSTPTETAPRPPTPVHSFWYKKCMQTSMKIETKYN